MNEHIYWWDAMNIQEQALGEAVHLLVKNGQLIVETYHFREEVPADGMIVRNLFSLTGTREELSALRFLPQSLNLSFHPGYASIGIVKATGRQWHKFTAGDWILLPAQYSTYTLLRASSLHPLGNLFKSISPLVDPVHYLFIPLVSLALHLARQAAEQDKPGILLLGCGLIGSVLLQILIKEREDAHILVYRDRDDLPAEMLYAFGVQEVVTSPQQLPQKLLQTVGQTYVFSADTNILHQGDRLTSQPCVCQEEVENTAGWLGNDMIEEAIEWIQYGRINTHELIAQHVHAEAITQVYDAILAKSYHGRAIVYDW